MKRFLLIPMLVFFLAAISVAEDQTPKVVNDPAKAFVTGSIVVKGEGAAPSGRPLTSPQKRILALRAAKVVALREVVEIIDGVSVSGETRVVDAAAQSDTVRATVEGIVKGAQVIRETYDPLSEMAVVYVSVSMTGPDGLIASLLPHVILASPGENPPFQPPAQAVQAKDYDGLILDVRALPFRPALINRVLTKNGEAVYDPSKVSQDILVEKGGAEYTNDIEKAKSLLGERGSTNPMVVKASGVQRSTDVEVTADDASAIFAANQSRNYLGSAKVVFVLK